MNEDKVSKSLERSYEVGIKKPKKDEDYSIDFSYWLKFDVWTLKQAASILENSEPRKLSMRLIYDETFRESFNGTMEVIMSAIGKSLKAEVISEKRDEEVIKFHQVNPAAFIWWASEKGFDIPEPLIQLLDKDEGQLPGNNSTNSPNSAISKKDQRVSEIFKLAKIWFDDPMRIPGGGKGKLRKTLCELKPGLYTEATFDDAWKAARTKNLIQMENIEQYKHSK